MSINRQTQDQGAIQIGPTDQGQVRIYVTAEGGIDLPMDFDPDEAEEIAEELQAAAARARSQKAPAERTKKAGKGRARQG